MKIAWFTPFHPSCGPGFMSYAVVQKLTQYFDVEVFCHWHPTSPQYEIPGVICHAISNDLNFAEIAHRFDAIFYNLGNNEENHYHILNALRKQPGIPILHDYVMQHAFVVDLFERKRNPDIYYWLLAYLYGTSGVLAAQEAYSLQKSSNERIGFWDSTAVARFPLFELAAQLGTGCVVHSHFFEENIKRVFPGPILRSRNPIDLKRFPSDEVVASFYSIRKKTRSKVIYSMFGHMSPNKCIDKVLRAFGLSAVLRENARLIICGGASPNYQEYLSQLTEACGITDCVEFRGKISDEELYALQVESDVFVNLRNPNTEGQSGSLIEQMAAGKPVVCFNSGCYQDVPENAAFKIDNPDDMQKLVRALEDAAKNLKVRQSVGLAGRKYAMEYDTSRYAREIFEFVFSNRDYLKAMQTGNFDLLLADKERHASLNDHCDSLQRAEIAWRVIEQRIEPDSQEAFDNLPPEVASKFASFLRNRNKPLIEAMEMIIDETLGERPSVSLAGHSRFEIPNSPTLDRAFWSAAEAINLNEFVPLCYQRILCREPDPVGVNRYLEALSSEGLSRRQLIKTLLKSNEATSKFDLESEQTFLLLEWCDAESEESL